MTKIWVIYDHPTDYPDSAFVVREHHVNNGKGKCTEHIGTADTLEHIRRQVPRGKMRVPRREDDPPQIVEWWF